MLSLRLEEEQFQAFKHLVDNVLNLTREAAEIVEDLARGARGDAEATAGGGTKAARKTDDEDYLLICTES